MGYNGRRGENEVRVGLPRVVKWCKSEGVKDKLPPNSYIVLPPLADQKKCKSGGLICLLPPHSYTILPPLEAQCSPKIRKSFELHFPKESSHCSPTLTSFWAEKFNPGSIVLREFKFYKNRAI